ncbi:MAG: sensor histidine kinase [Candidatus Dormibacteria bacterium]
MARLRKAIDGPWPRALGVLALIFFTVAGSIGAAQGGPAPNHLDAFGVALIIGAGATLWFAPAHKTAAFLSCLGLLLVYFALGYITSSPWWFALIFVTSRAVIWNRPMRTIAGAALAFGSMVLAAYAFNTPGRGHWEPWAVLTTVALAAIAGHVVGYSNHRSELRSAQAREDDAQRRITEERLRIARELHDVVSHSISLINVQAGVGAHVIDTRPDQAKESLLLIKQTSREALRELRAILGVLRQVDDAEGRMPAPGLGQLEHLVDASQRAGLKTVLLVEGTAQTLPPDVDLAAYRIVQESLTNALRHAGTAEVELRLTYRAEELLIVVADDGRGAATPEMTEGAGHGIAGMRERATAAGGLLEAGPRPEGGFRVRATLPLGAG